jgi:hypothetical protein
MQAEYALVALMVGFVDGSGIRPVRRHDTETKVSSRT